MSSPNCAKPRMAKRTKTVAAWAAGVPASVLFLSVIIVMELEQGTLLVERRDAIRGAVLRLWLDRRVLPAFADRVLPIDTAVARHCARLHVPDPRAERDALIAATALVYGMVIVTRNVADFEPTGVRIINPWQYRPKTR